ncbi:hypothetical protein GJR96_00035 [Haloferax sp. MBLA0076]|uniref:Uncharacterized protein n=1 Tax=Haloferax litoreum TaxID=2666140 RepID=A0A6A8GDW5_9EURY|nr:MULTISPECIES: hypothetical protein [Haloferax]KAB1191910.1 hypothetical protein Hfx1148_00035 [Haloferax sp. CBA1148]MRX20347.1 hypothetical protein [Haloferax litoreum]
MNRTQQGTFARDAVVATAVLAGLYLLGYGVQFQPLQIPTYLLIVGFDLVEAAFGSAGANYDLLFAAYIVGLGLVGATVAHVLRLWARETDLSQWRLGAAGAVAIVGTLSLLFGLRILLVGGQLTPVLVTGTAGLILLGVSGWLSGLLRVELGATQ